MDRPYYYSYIAVLAYHTDKTVKYGQRSFYKWLISGQGKHQQGSSGDVDKQ